MRVSSDLYSERLRNLPDAVILDMYTKNLRNPPDVLTTLAGALSSVLDLLVVLYLLQLLSSRRKWKCPSAPVACQILHAVQYMACRRNSPLDKAWFAVRFADC